MDTVPVIDVRALVDATSGLAARHEVAARMGAACRHNGFFYVVGHGVDEGLQARLRDAEPRVLRAGSWRRSCRSAWPWAGRAWRGYFRVGDELTSGKPDQKEGLYFGAELPADDPRVRAGTPLHGPNLFPAGARGLPRGGAGVHGRAHALGHALMAGLALSLGLEESYFADRGTGEPLTLFRIFNYPPPADPDPLGRGRAHRLRPADDPAAGRRRRPGGEVARRGGSPPRRCRARSSATSATCSTG